MHWIQATCLTLLGVGVVQAQVEPEEFRQRRQRLLGAFDDGVVLLHARPTAAALDQHRFRQEPTFYYFTGLADQPSAILVLDGPRGQSSLFVPPPPEGFGGILEGVGLSPGPDAARDVRVDSVRSWDELEGYLNSRLEAGVRRFYLDEPRRPVPAGNPPGLAPMAGEHTLWRAALTQAFPAVEIHSAAAFIREMRWVKSPAEVEVLRRVAEASTLDSLSPCRGAHRTPDRTSAAPPAPHAAAA